MPNEDRLQGSSCHSQQYKQYTISSSILPHNSQYFLAIRNVASVRSFSCISDKQWIIIIVMINIYQKIGGVRICWHYKGIMMAKKFRH